jgi:hypothetical protein
MSCLNPEIAINRNPSIHFGLGSLQHHRPA